MKTGSCDKHGSPLDRLRWASRAALRSGIPEAIRIQHRRRASAFGDFH